jgi:hypothetical protein
MTSHIFMARRNMNKQETIRVAYLRTNPDIAYETAPKDIQPKPVRDCGLKEAVHHHARTQVQPNPTGGWSSGAGVGFGTGVMQTQPNFRTQSPSTSSWSSSWQEPSQQTFTFQAPTNTWATHPPPGPAPVAAQTATAMYGWEDEYVDSNGYVGASVWGGDDEYGPYYGEEGFDYFGEFASFYGA